MIYRKSRLKKLCYAYYLGYFYPEQKKYFKDTYGIEYPVCDFDRFSCYLDGDIAVLRYGVGTVLVPYETIKRMEVPYVG